MKKIIALVLLLALLSAGAFCMIGNAVSAEKANVTIKENILYGDRSYAEGVTVFTRAHYDRHLFWNTAYTVGKNPKCDTAFTFHYSEFYENEKPHPEALSLEVDLKYGFDTTVPAESSVGLQKAYRELFDATAPGTKGTKTVYLQNYYTYYPIRVTIALPGTLWQGNDYEKLTFEEYRNERAVWDKFNEFFKIPIPKDLPGFEISVTKDAQGKRVGIGANSMEKELLLAPVSTYTSDRCFFSIGNRYLGREGDTEYADTGLIPGGYGIYSFHFKQVRNPDNTHGSTTIFHSGYETGVEEDTLATVYPLDSEVTVKHLSVSDDESKLLVFTLEKDSTYLTVIDIATMTELQKLRITDDDSYIISEYENFIALNGFESLSVIEIGADGQYRLAFTVPKQTDINKSAQILSDQTQMAFDGDRLVMIYYLYEPRYGAVEICGFSMAIYDQTGLVYYAEYKSSLSVNTSTTDYSFNCLPLSFQVSWEE